MATEVKTLVNELIADTVEKHLFDISKNELQDKDSILSDKVSDLEKQVTILRNELTNQREREMQEHRVREEVKKRREEEHKKAGREAKNMGFEVIEKEASKIPDIIIIVPYRDREPQRAAFMQIMPHMMEDKNCKILMIHQRDKRPFNRGGMKNIGFLYVKNLYPRHYQNITLVFHDIDNMPWHKNQFSYQTTRGTVNHFYGFTRALGGIFAIKGGDFEHINGFPNIWTWGLEDNIISQRCIKNRKKIVRPQFVNVETNNKNIIGLWHGWDRLISPNIENKMKYDNGSDGIRSLTRVRYGSTKMTDLFTEVNVVSFQTGESLSSPFVKHAAIRNARLNARQNRPFLVRGPKRGTAGTFGKKRGFGGMAI